MLNEQKNIDLFFIQKNADDQKLLAQFFEPTVPAPTPPSTHVVETLEPFTLSGLIFCMVPLAKSVATQTMNMWDDKSAGPNKDQTIERLVSKVSRMAQF